jgi:hypothetical protein
MNYELDMDNLKMDYNTLSPEELLSEYRNDDNYELEVETMRGSNITAEDIEFNPQAQPEAISKLRNKLQNSKIPEALKNAMLYGK